MSRLSSLADTVRKLGLLGTFALGILIWTATSYVVGAFKVGWRWMSNNSFSWQWLDSFINWTVVAVILVLIVLALGTKDYVKGVKSWPRRFVYFVAFVAVVFTAFFFVGDRVDEVQAPPVVFNEDIKQEVALPPINPKTGLANYMVMRNQLGVWETAYWEIIEDGGLVRKPVVPTDCGTWTYDYIPHADGGIETVAHLKYFEDSDSPDSTRKCRSPYTGERMVPVDKSKVPVSPSDYKSAAIARVFPSEDDRARRATDGGSDEPTTLKTLVDGAISLTGYGPQDPKDKYRKKNGHTFEINCPPAISAGQYCKQVTVDPGRYYQVTARDGTCLIADVESTGRREKEGRYARRVYNDSDQAITIYNVHLEKGASYERPSGIIERCPFG